MFQLVSWMLPTAIHWDVLFAGGNGIGVDSGNISKMVVAERTAFYFTDFHLLEAGRAWATFYVRTCGALLLE